MKKESNRPGRRVPKKEVDQLLARPQVTRDAKLLGLGVVAYRLGVDEVLTVDDRGGGVIYPSAYYDGTFAKFMPGGPRKHHYLEGRTLPTDFEACLPQRIDEGKRVISAATKAPVDLTVAGLAVVDKYCKKIGRKRCIEPDLLPLVVAVVGETMRLAKKGRWEVRSSQQSGLGEYKEAWIVGDAGWDWDATWTVVHALRDGGTLQVAVQGALGEPGWER